MRKAQKVGAQKTEKVFETGAKKASEAAKAFKKGIKEGIEERKNAHVGKERDSRNTVGFDIITASANSQASILEIAHKTVY